MQKNLSSTMDEAAETIPAALNAVIFYDDVPAARRAMRVLEQSTELAYSVEACPQLWRFDLLQSPACREIPIIDAIGAGIIVVSSSDATALPKAVERWLKQCFVHKSGSGAAVVALLGAAHDMNQPDSPSLRYLQSAASEAKLAFFAPSPGSHEKKCSGSCRDRRDACGGSCRRRHERLPEAAAAI